MSLKAPASIESARLAHAPLRSRISVFFLGKRLSQPVFAAYIQRAGFGLTSPQAVPSLRASWAMGDAMLSKGEGEHPLQRVIAWQGNGAGNGMYDWQ